MPSDEAGGQPNVTVTGRLLQILDGSRCFTSPRSPPPASTVLNGLSWSVEVICSPKPPQLDRNVRVAGWPWQAAPRAPWPARSLRRWTESSCCSRCRRSRRPKHPARPTRASARHLQKFSGMLVFVAFHLQRPKLSLVIAPLNPCNILLPCKHGVAQLNASSSSACTLANGQRRRCGR